MRQAIVNRPGNIMLRDVEPPTAAQGQVLVRVRRLGICGSDTHVYHGQHPYVTYPVIQGHEVSGEVVIVGAGVKGFRGGEKVTIRPQLVCGRCYSCTHGQYNICNTLTVLGFQAPGAAQEYFAVDEKLVLRVPDEMELDHAAMVEPVAVAVHAVGRLGNVHGMNVAVLGAGPIGNLTAQVAKALGAASVLITDVSDQKLKIASECGIDHIVNSLREDVERAITERYGTDRADAILECVGSETTIEQAVSVSRKGTEIVVVGVFRKKPTVDIGLVQDKELRILGSLMYTADDFKTAIELMISHSVTVAPLISAHFPFNDYAKGYEYIDRNREQCMKVIINVSM